MLGRLAHLHVTVNTAMGRSSAVCDCGVENGLKTHYYFLLLL